MSLISQKSDSIDGIWYDTDEINEIHSNTIFFPVSDPNVIKLLQFNLLN